MIKSDLHFSTLDPTGLQKERTNWFLKQGLPFEMRLYTWEHNKSTRWYLIDYQEWRRFSRKLLINSPFHKYWKTKRAGIRNTEGNWSIFPGIKCLVHIKKHWILTFLQVLSICKTQYKLKKCKFSMRGEKADNTNSWLELIPFECWLNQNLRVTDQYPYSRLMGYKYCSGSARGKKQNHIFSGNFHGLFYSWSYRGWTGLSRVFTPHTD